MYNGGTGYKNPSTTLREPVRFHEEEGDHLPHRVMASKHKRKRQSKLGAWSGIGKSARLYFFEQTHFKNLIHSIPIEELDDFL